MKKTITFTKDGLAKMQQEYDTLKSKRPEAVRLLSEARDMGDRSENAAYKVARQKLSSIDRQIARLSYVLRIAVVHEPKTTDTIEIGSVVTVENNGEKKEFTIVGGYESDLSTGRISQYSPIGKALLGYKTGREVQVSVPNGISTFTILSVKN